MGLFSLFTNPLKNLSQIAAADHYLSNNCGLKVGKIFGLKKEGEFWNRVKEIFEKKTADSYSDCSEPTFIFIALLDLYDNGYSILHLGKETCQSQINIFFKRYEFQIHDSIIEYSKEILELDTHEDSEVIKPEQEEKQITDELKEGFITKEYDNGEKYVGYFKDDKRHGIGTYTFTSGNKYVGEWKDDKIHGQGTFTWANGDKYVGEFKDGTFNGQGTRTDSDGTKYFGEWKDGKMHGQGTLTHSDGGKYVGEFMDGLPHGQGTFTFADGEKVVGEFKDGMPKAP